MMMPVNIFQNPGFLQVQHCLHHQLPVEISLEALQLSAIANTDDPIKAWTLTQAITQPWQQPWLTILRRDRATTIGDVMQTKDGCYWLIAFGKFIPLASQPGSQWLKPATFQKFQLDGLLEREHRFVSDGFCWQVAKVLEYDLKQSRSTVLACQGPPMDQLPRPEH